MPISTDELSIETNSVDPEKTAPIGVNTVLKHFSRREKQTTFVGIGPLRVKNLNLMNWLKRRDKFQNIVVS